MQVSEQNNTVWQCDSSTYSLPSVFCVIHPAPAVHVITEVVSFVIMFVAASVPSGVACMCVIIGASVVACCRSDVLGFTLYGVACVLGLLVQVAAIWYSISLFVPNLSAGAHYTAYLVLMLVFSALVLVMRGIGTMYSIRGRRGAYNDNSRHEEFTKS